MRRYGKLIVPFVLLALISGCGVPAEEKRLAREYEKEYQQEFMDKVKEEFGEDAGLEDISGEIEERKDTVWSSTQYYASGRLTGIIVLNRQNYDAVYDPSSKELLSSVNNEKIRESLLEVLPLDGSRIISFKMNGGDKKKVLFSRDADDIKKALQEKSIDFTIETSEDLSHFDQDDFEDLSEFCNRPYYSFKIKLIYGSQGKIEIISASDGEYIIK